MPNPPRFLEEPSSPMPCSPTPVARTAPSLEDGLDLRGVAVPGGFRLRPLAAAGASFRTSYSLFSLPRGAPCCPRLQERRGPLAVTNFGAQSHGLSDRCLRFAGRVATAPRKTRSRLVANPLPTGLIPARAPVRSFRHRLHDFLFSRLCLAQLYVAHDQLDGGSGWPRRQRDRDPG